MSFPFETSVGHPGMILSSPLSHMVEWTTLLFPGKCLVMNEASEWSNRTNETIVSSH